MAEERKLTVRIHNEGADGLWAEVLELEGCFASGFDPDELREALEEAIGQYLSRPGRPATVKIEDEGKPIETVREERILVTC